MEKRLLNITFYKIFLIILKYIPSVLIVFEMVYILGKFFNLNFIIADFIGGTSFITWLILYLASYVFQFCFWYRLSLYYIFITKCAICYNYYHPILSLVWLNIILIGLYIIVLLYIIKKDN